MWKKTALFLLVCTMAALCADPDIYMSFNRGIQADFGGTGANGTVLEGFRDPIGMKGTIMPAGKMSEEALLVPSVEGKGVRIGKLDGKGIYKVRYNPSPALSRLAGTVSLWVRPDD